MTWLVTGGAGYIGSHVVRALSASGREVVVVDDMSSGRADRVPADVPLARSNVLDTRFLLRLLESERVTGVVHLAAKKAVDESMTAPLYYYRENVGGFQSVLEACVTAGVARVLLSSSAAVYGPTGATSVTEDSATDPANPYGASKLICERLLRDVAAAEGLSWLALRYFNVAGTVEPALADDGVSNLIPKAFRALDAGVPPVVFGDDYPTPDGTCVRDFVHVQDVAEAHVAAVARLEDEPPAAAVYNVGRGSGYSVAQVLATIAAVTGRRTPPRRAGAPATPPRWSPVPPPSIATSAGPPGATSPRWSRAAGVAGRRAPTAGVPASPPEAPDTLPCGPFQGRSP
jgi:UDP-glucose 4-epimerase